MSGMIDEDDVREHKDYIQEAWPGVGMYEENSDCGKPNQKDPYLDDEENEK